MTFFFVGLLSSACINAMAHGWPQSSWHTEHSFFNLSLTCFVEPYLRSWPHFAMQWMLIHSWMEELESDWQERVTAPELGSVPWNEEDNGERWSIKFMLSMRLKGFCVTLYSKFYIQNFNSHQQLSVSLHFLLHQASELLSTWVTTSCLLLQGIQPSVKPIVLSADVSQRFN